MAQTTVSFHMDENLKRSMEQLCSDLGLTMTAAFTIFAKKMTRESRIPFDVSIEQPNADTLAAIAEVQRMKAEPTTGKSYSTAAEMLEDILE